MTEKAMAPQSSTLAWKIPWTEEPDGLQSMGSQGIGHNHSEPACINARLFFACGSSVPVRVEREGGAAAWLVGTLAALSVQGYGLPLLSLWPHQSLFSSLL